jgi:hypothetical protein
LGLDTPVVGRDGLQLDIPVELSFHIQRAQHQQLSPVEGVPDTAKAPHGAVQHEAAQHEARQQLRIILAFGHRMPLPRLQCMHRPSRWPVLHHIGRE